jgi:hypothetical protein
MYNIKITKIDDNTIDYIDLDKRKELIPVFNYLLSMGIFEGMQEGKEYSLTNYLQTIRNEYINNESILTRIDKLIM